MSISIVIVNYNVKFYLEQCLYSVMDSIRASDVKVFVIDNASKDGSIEYLQPLFPSVRFIKNQENVGFGKANNQILNEFNQSDFILFLNPDTIISKTSLEQSITYIKNYDRVGAVGVRMIDGKGNFLRESKRGKMGLWESFCKFSGLISAFPKSKIFSGYYEGWKNERSPSKVHVLSGAYLMIRANLFREIGGFDPIFFMYGEDIDLCYAVEKRGYENHYLGNLSILHFKGESTKFDLRYVNVFFEAMVLFQKKWKKKLEIIFSKPFIYIIKLIYVLCFTFSGNRKNAPTNVKVNTGNNNLLGEKCGVLKLHSEKGLDWIHIIGPAWTQEEMITSIENNKGIKHFIHAKGSGSIISYRATMSLI